MVRLKDKEFEKYLPYILFQFLYGAIKSIICGRIRVDFFWFQFLYGAIKSRLRYRVLNHLQDFNSYMVRLKVYEAENGGWVACLFQFLYGAIKSNNSRLNRRIFYISIPIWCD